ncbi:unnamed protein product [Effrenium voratum]|nr:unnamed protein product [Effrenium voratum]
MAAVGRPLSATWGAPPPTPSAAAAISLLGPSATSPAPQAPQAPHAPQAPQAPHAPPTPAAAAINLLKPNFAVTAPAAPAAPAAPPPQDKDAKLVGSILAAAPMPHAGQDQSGRDAGVLDSFLRKVPDARRKPAPLSVLDAPQAQAQHDDAMLQQLVGRGGLRPEKQTGRMESFQGYAGYGGYADAPLERGAAYGLPVARRSVHSERPRGAPLGRGHSRRSVGGGGLAKVRTNIIEERAKDDLHEENLQLRRAQTEMKSRLQKLQVKIRSAQEEPREAKALEQKASDLEQLQRALSAPSKAKASTSPGVRRGTRSSRQQSQRRSGGRLRSRMSVPWSQAPAPAPHVGYPAESRSSPRGVHVLPALHVQPESPSRHASQSPQAGRRSPRAPAPEVPSVPAPALDRRPAAPLALDVKEPLPAHTQSLHLSPMALPSPLARSPQEPLLSDFEQRIMSQNKQKAEELRQRNRELSSRLDELLVQQISADHFQEKQKSRYKEKAKAMDAKIRSLEAALERLRDKGRQVDSALQHDKQQLEVDVAVLSTQLHHAQVASSAQEDTSELRAQLAQAQASADEMKRQIRDITKFAFSSATDQRMISEQRMKELEELLAKKTEESNKLITERQQIDAEREEVSQEASALEQQSRNFLEDNERKAIQMEERAKAVRRAQAQLSEVLDTLTEEDRKVMVFSLQFLREREERAAAEVAARANAQRSTGLAGPPPPPMPGQRVSVEELTRRVDAIRAQKDELAYELRALQKISQRERDITKDLRKLNQMDLEEIGSQMQVTMAEIERFKQLAEDREQRVKELQMRLVKRRDQRLVKPRLLGERADIVSEQGFSDLSEVFGDQNILDLYVTVGQIEERALLELPRQGPVLSQVPPPTSLVTLVIAEFMHCDVGSSETAGGLRPRFDSLLSFGPFQVGDAEVEHFAKGALRLELQAFSSGGSAAYVLGRASLPLATLLDCTPQDPNPVVAGTLCFAAEADGRVQIAAVGYKARWRRSIIQAVESYALRRGAPGPRVREVDALTGLRLKHMQASQPEKWCFANRESINGPFVTSWHAELWGLKVAYVVSTTIREPGWQCRTLAFGRGPLARLQGPAVCRKH